MRYIQEALLLAAIAWSIIATIAMGVAPFVLFDRLGWWSLPVSAIGFVFWLSCVLWLEDKWP